MVQTRGRGGVDRPFAKSVGIQSVGRPVSRAHVPVTYTSLNAALQRKREREKREMREGREKRSKRAGGEEINTCMSIIHTHIHTRARIGRMEPWSGHSHRRACTRERRRRRYTGCPRISGQARFPGTAGETRANSRSRAPILFSEPRSIAPRPKGPFSEIARGMKNLSRNVRSLFGADFTRGFILEF